MDALSASLPTFLLPFMVRFASDRHFEPPNLPWEPLSTYVRQLVTHPLCQRHQCFMLSPAPLPLPAIPSQEKNWVEARRAKPLSFSSGLRWSPQVGREGDYRLLGYSKAPYNFVYPLFLFLSPGIISPASREAERLGFSCVHSWGHERTQLLNYV